MDIASQIAAALAEYSDEVNQKLEDAKSVVADETVAYLKANSPVGNRGKYAKGWRKGKQPRKKGNGYVVYNSTDYRLTHLLEKGHAKRNGGRTKAEPHISDAERLAIEKMGAEIQR